MENNLSNSKNIPRHVAIVMDGNGRWAQQRLLPRMVGHNNGVEAVRKVVKFCIENDIKALTLFAFSSENWKRSNYEVSALMTLLQKVLNNEVNKLHESNIKLSVIGDVTRLSSSLQQSIEKAQALTKNNSKLKLNIAINYGGRWDIVNAMKSVGYSLLSGNLNINDITENEVNKYLTLNDMPDVDLLIRTSGEQRISNFLLWQLAYTEIYFTETLWPDFNESSMADALKWFAKRQRRFGCSNEIADIDIVGYG